MTRKLDPIVWVRVRVRVRVRVIFEVVILILYLYDVCIYLYLLNFFESRFLKKSINSFKKQKRQKPNGLMAAPPYLMLNISWGSFFCV